MAVCGEDESQVSGEVKERSDLTFGKAMVSNETVSDAATHKPAIFLFLFQLIRIKFCCLVSALHRRTASWYRWPQKWRLAKFRRRAADVRFHRDHGGRV